MKADARTQAVLEWLKKNITAGHAVFTISATDAQTLLSYIGVLKARSDAGQILFNQKQETNDKGKPNSTIQITRRYGSEGQWIGDSVEALEDPTWPLGRPPQDREEWAASVVESARGRHYVFGFDLAQPGSDRTAVWPRSPDPRPAAPPPPGDWSRPDTAKGVNLDAWAEVYGLVRGDGETDAQLRDRIMGWAVTDMDGWPSTVAAESGQHPPRDLGGFDCGGRYRLPLWMITPVLDRVVMDDGDRRFFVIDLDNGFHPRNTHGRREAAREAFRKVMTWVPTMDPRPRPGHYPGRYAK